MGDLPALGHRPAGASRAVTLAEDAAEAATSDVGHERGHCRGESACLASDCVGSPTRWGTPTADNRYVGWPYTKHEVAVMDVDMSAALLVATAEKADALGVDEDRRLYLTGWAYAEDPASIAERSDMSRSVGHGSGGTRHALVVGGHRTSTTSTWFDLYSCFPSSVRLACDAIGLALDDPRGH